MIFTTPDDAKGKRLLLIDQHDVDRLRGGHALATGDGLVLVYLVHDPKFVNDKIQDALAVAPTTIESLVAIVEEDRKRRADAGPNWKRGKAGGPAVVDAKPDGV